MKSDESKSHSEEPELHSDQPNSNQPNSEPKSEPNSEPSQTESVAQLKELILQKQSENTLLTKQLKELILQKHSENTLLTDRITELEAEVVELKKLVVLPVSSPQITLSVPISLPTTGRRLSHINKLRPRNASSVSTSDQEDCQSQIILEDEVLAAIPIDEPRISEKRQGSMFGGFDPTKIQLRSRSSTTSSPSPLSSTIRPLSTHIKDSSVTEVDAVQIKKWIVEKIGVMEDGDLDVVLRDGKVLCGLMNVLHPTGEIKIRAGKFAAFHRVFLGLI